MNPSLHQRVELPLRGESAPDVPPPPAPAESKSVVDLSPEQVRAVEENIIAALHTCYDPEIPVNIYELGLIYKIEVTSTGAVSVRMTLTSPACPAAGSLPPEVHAKVEAIPEVTAVKVDVVWDPPWHQDLMSEAAKLQLGIYDY